MFLKTSHNSFPHLVFVLDIFTTCPSVSAILGTGGTAVSKIKMAGALRERAL